MSNQGKKSIYDIVLDSTEKEINMLKDEIAFLLKNPVTKEDIERIEQRLGELESRIMT
ncbi:DUF5320 domain-containing protein [Rickettsia hoogstraalii]|uniref:Uncharacterized protein n=1 Tax=Rickettsia felis str. Pedreira TaxID=1359196 RepID=A0A0F3MSB9_RICFI|nr:MULTISPECIES: DUF5320 domain-containing protein [spotted fever group]KJV81931.1 hypothetical protein RHORCCE3_1130 [Rickettsia hoogstraalii str. RCCE3]MCC8406592.1 DUF5320 domain-containing protein [Rickettsia endosymbiont of Sceptobius lativentris]MCC8462187.1 DUF5320 domain-containing protein [Rickettsia endosymbiont of Ecitomorpha arachnoides]KJV58347.1 hypothetical protein RFEPED_0727 [Rickettsia felis str. Pedreira]MCX4084338.1 DUF5320 domain-containing protein [Rickettsia hoogstraalii